MSADALRIVREGVPSQGSPKPARPNHRSQRTKVSYSSPVSGAGGTHFIPHQLVSRDGIFQLETPRSFFHSAVLTNRWRLVNGKELYDIKADPGQQHDITAEHSQVVAHMRCEYESWWADVTVRFGEYLEIPIGAEEAGSVRRTSFGWYTGGPPNQREIQRAPSEGPRQEGFWAIEVIRAGQYRVPLRQQPREAGFAIDGTTAPLSAKFNSRRSQSLSPRSTQGMLSACRTLDAPKRSYQIGWGA